MIEVGPCSDACHRQRPCSVPGCAVEGTAMETAMDIVRRAQRGEIDHDELVRILKTWHYEP